MDTETTTIINKFIREVSGKIPGLITAYLFGSRARDKQRYNSDIDVALIFDNLKDTDKFDIQVQLILIASQIDSRIEPHPLSVDDLNTVTPFAHEITTTGVELSF